MTPLAFRLVPYEPHCNYATMSATRHEISRDNEGDPVWLQPGVISICFHVSIIEKINEWKLFSCVELPWLIGQLVDISIEMVLTGWPSILLNSGLNIKLLVSSHLMKLSVSTQLVYSPSPSPYPLYWARPLQLWDPWPGAAGRAGCQTASWLQRSG